MTIISLTFDDGLDCHLDTAIPLLDRFGLHGTFFIDVGSERFARRRDEWQTTAANGHELGNHTVFHPGVSTKPWVTEGIAIENYTLDRMDRELRMANSVLAMLDGRAERTFAFPCSNPFLGRPGWPRRLLTRTGLERTRLMGWIDRFGLDAGSQLVDYTPLVRERFIAARCGGLPATALPAVPPNRYRIGGVEGDGLDAEQLSAAVDAAIERQAWLVLVFHGIGGGHRLSCDRDVFESLLAKLAADSRVEVLTFLNAAKRIWS